jgi:hypothetical protein
MLRGVYANPEKELVRLRDAGKLTQVARGTYIAKPDDIAPDRPWKLRFEAAALAYATAIYGDRVPVLFGLSAARVHHAIPRAIGVVFTVRDPATVDARPERTELGPAMVASPEQALIDLIRWPDLGGMPAEARAAVAPLWDRVDRERLTRLLGQAPATVRRTVNAAMGGRNG